MEQSKENEDQRMLIAVQKQKILHLEDRLLDKRIDIAESGTLAEAALNKALSASGLSVKSRLRVAQLG